LAHEDKEKEPEEFLDYIGTQVSSVSDLIKSAKPTMPEKQLQMMMMMARSNPQMLFALGINPNRIMKELELAEKAQAFRDLSPTKKQEQDRSLWLSWLTDYIKIIEVDRKSYGKLDYEEKRKEIMNANNPRLVLRNWMAQSAIQRAEEGDYSEVEKLFLALCDPYQLKSVVNSSFCKIGKQSSSSSETESEIPDNEIGPSCDQCSKPKAKSYCGRVPDWARDIRVS